METKLYVGNLNFRTNEESLGEAFAGAGFTPVSIKVITDRETGRSRGFAFVELADEKTAEAALAQMHDKLVDGRPLKVTEAKPRAPGGFSNGAGAGGGDFRPPPRPRPNFDDRPPRSGPPGGSHEARGPGGGGYDNRGGAGGGGYDNRGGGGGGGFDNRGGGGFHERPPSGPGGGYDSRPRFGGGGRDGGYGGSGAPRFGGNFAPPQPGFGPPTEDDTGRDPRRDRSKRRDLSKQHAERQELDDDDGWA